MGRSCRPETLLENAKKGNEKGARRERVETVGWG